MNVGVSDVFARIDLNELNRLSKIMSQFQVAQSAIPNFSQEQIAAFQNVHRQLEMLSSFRSEIYLTQKYISSAQNIVLENDYLKTIAKNYASCSKLQSMLIAFYASSRLVRENTVNSALDVAKSIPAEKSVEHIFDDEDFLLKLKDFINKNITPLCSTLTNGFNTDDIGAIIAFIVCLVVMFVNAADTFTDDRDDKFKQETL